MGFAFGENNNGREIGYGVEATCDWSGCNADIDRGMAFCCGDPTNAGMEDMPYCGNFFCGKHKPGEVCLNCEPKLDCPDCKGDGRDDDQEGGLCQRCDSLGSISIEDWEQARRFGEVE